MPESLAVARIGPGDVPPTWIDFSDAFLSVTRTADEVSVVGLDASIPAGVRAERGWRAFKVAGPLDFSLTGVLAGIAGPLAEAGVSIFALSTYDTDYVLVRDADVDRACTALAETHRVERE
jgi:hypothetical protein